MRIRILVAAALVMTTSGCGLIESMSADPDDLSYLYDQEGSDCENGSTPPSSGYAEIAMANGDSAGAEFWRQQDEFYCGIKRK